MAYWIKVFFQKPRRILNLKIPQFNRLNKELTEFNRSFTKSLVLQIAVRLV